MLDIQSYVCSELVKVQQASGQIVISKPGYLFAASWECKCGAKQQTPICGLTIASTAENGKASYREHCAAVHRG